MATIALHVSGGSSRGPEQAGVGGAIAHRHRLPPLRTMRFTMESRRKESAKCKLQSANCKMNDRRPIALGAFTLHFAPCTLHFAIVYLSFPCLLALLAPARLYAAEEPQITAALGQSEIYQGQAVVYQVRVENVENPPAPDVHATADFDVALLGQQSLDSQFISNDNGVIRQEIHRGREFRYRLTPKRIGEILIPAAVLKVGGQTLASEPLRLAVLPPSAQDLVALEVTCDRPAVYPTQPFTVTLSVFVKTLPPPAADRDPLSVQSHPPMLHIPWLVDEELPHGLSPQEDWQRWAKRFIDSEGAGFGINDLAHDNVFAMFGESNVIAFRPRPQTVSRRDAHGQTVAYRRYDFRRTFTATQVGPITLGPVTLQGVFAVGASDSGRLTGKEVYAASKPLLIQVDDVPREGRPEGYVGAIGRFAVQADLTPRQSKLGDPLTFTLTLRGTGSLATVKAPDLARIPAVARRFKVYDATQKTEGDTARFVYALRPLEEGQEPFPAVPLAYFDADRRQYVTLQSEPIPISIAKAERLSGDQIVAAPRAAGAAGPELESRREGIFADITDPAAIRDQSVRPAGWLAGLGGCVALYGLLALVTTAVRRRWQDKASLRRRSAATRARRQLAAATVQWQASHVREAADLIQDAFSGLIADVADLHHAGLTPKDVLQHLQDCAFPVDLTARVGALMDSCDAARYGGLATFASLDHEAHELLESVIDTLRTQKRLR